MNLKSNNNEPIQNMLDLNYNRTKSTKGELIMLETLGVGTDDLNSANQQMEADRKTRFSFNKISNDLNLL